ncbi:MAG: AAA family ATPase [Streptosporangiaceae bacterium]|nr:AAA family ATPase [Streptosporangiaceae bacterium]
MSSAQVELRLAGEFGVVRDGVALLPGKIGSRKARTLLKLLAVERPGMVSADRIIDVLWTGAPPAAAGQAVATLVSRLRAALGSGVILGGRDGYRLAGEPGVSVDLDAAARYCEQAEYKLPTAAAIALAAAGRVTELLTVDTALADEPYATWADPARTELRNLLRRARLAAAEAALATGDPRLALRHAEAATAADPLDETAQRWCMSAAAALGETAKALLAYATLCERLREELGADPAPQTRELHLAILREHSAAPGRRPAVTPRSQRSRPAAGLVGRDAEARVLRGSWLQAAAGGPGLVMVIGEAGIGKTTLAEDFAAEAEQDGATVLRTRCYEAERSLFLQPIVEAVAPVAGHLQAAAVADLLGENAPALAALLPEIAAALGPPPSWRAGPDMERRRCFDAVTAFLSGLAGRNPVLLVVDDLQYAGQSTVEFVHYLARHVSGARLLVVVTVRAEHDEQIGAALAPVATRLEVGPLGPAAVAQLAGEAGHEALAEAILRRTRGHTLFVVEVLRALAAGEDGVPESLRGAVQARVTRTGPAAETLLRAASVLGSAFDPLILGELLDLAPAAAIELCERALRARLLTVTGRDFEFANDLIREVMYATTPEPTRIAYHRRAADLLTAQPEVLARHASAAGDWRRAARGWVLAAEEAVRRYATSDSIALSTQALAAADRVGDAEISAQAQVIRGCAYEAAGDYDAALGDLTLGAAAARAVGDRRLEMRALSGLGRSRPWKIVTGSHVATPAQRLDYYTANLTSGLRIAESLGDRASETDLLSRLAVTAANRLRLDAALDYGLRAVAAARASADERALAAGLDGLKTAYLNLGDLPGLAAVLTELDPLLRRLGDLFLLQWTEFETAYLAIASADWDRAVLAMETAIEVNRRGGYPHCAAWYTAHLGWLAGLRGRDDEAVTLGGRAVDIAERHEHSCWLAAACAMLATTVLVLGDRPGAIGLLERGLAAAEEAGMEGYLLRSAAPLAAATGSATVLAEADRLLADAGIPPGGAWLLGEEAYLALARAWLGRGEPDRARAVLAPLLELAGRVPWPSALAGALVADGQALIRMGSREQAKATLLRAERLAVRHGLPHVRREARSALGNLDLS